MRAVPVGVASIVPHVTVRGNGGVGTWSDWPACGPLPGGACQREDAVVEFPGAAGNSTTAYLR